MRKWRETLKTSNNTVLDDMEFWCMLKSDLKRERL